MHLMTEATKSPATLSLKFFRKSHNNFELFLVVLVVLVVVFSSDVTTFEIILYDIPGNKVLPVCNKIIAHIWLLGPWWAERDSEQPAVQRDGNKYKLYFLYEVNGSSCSSCRFFLFCFFFGHKYFILRSFRCWPEWLLLLLGLFNAWISFILIAYKPSSSCVFTCISWFHSFIARHRTKEAFDEISDRILEDVVCCIGDIKLFEYTLQ